MSLFEKIIIKFSEGGPFFTYPILILLFVIIGIFIYDLIKKSDYSKTISLISHLSWFTIAWGFYGRTIGLISAFDNVFSHGELTVKLLAEGFKMALLNPLFAIMVFLIARACIIVLTIMQKKEEQ